MGNLSSNNNNNNFDMTDSDEDSHQSESEEIFHDPAGGDRNYLRDHYIVYLLHQLVDSNEVNFLTSSEDFKLPTIKRKPNLEKLKKNELYEMIKQASGYGQTNLQAPWSMLKMISNRQSGVGARDGSFTQFDRSKINNHFLPNKKERTVLKMNSKVFCGVLSQDGSRFVAASQDYSVRVLDSSNNKYKTINELNAKHINWSILDLDVSADAQHFAYCSWSDCIHISELDGDSNSIQCLPLQPEANRFGVFSLKFSHSGNQILCGANDGHVYIFDREVHRRLFRFPVSFEDRSVDVNSVCFVDDSSNIFVNGSDDGVIKAWDKRCLNQEHPESIGTLVGHWDGITYMDSKMDSRYLLSNSKDQSIKLWDLRCFASANAERTTIDRLHNQIPWDYRWDRVPKTFYSSTRSLPDDTSIMTYKGHRVQKSLLRARFSPALSTGQRYIYCGCASGRLIIYDLLTGKMVHTSGIAGHYDLVRDVAWHPQRQEILTSSFDQSINLNTYVDKSVEKKRRVTFSDLELPLPPQNDDSEEEGPPLRRSRRIALRRREDRQRGSNNGQEAPEPERNQPYSDDEDMSDINFFLDRTSARALHRRIFLTRNLRRTRHREQRERLLTLRRSARLRQRSGAAEPSNNNNQPARHNNPNAMDMQFAFDPASIDELEELRVIGRDQEIRYVRRR